MSQKSDNHSENKFEMRLIIKSFEVVYLLHMTYWGNFVNISQLLCETNDLNGIGYSQIFLSM